jgi:hypothetical protein
MRRVATGGSRRRARDIRAGHQRVVRFSISNQRYLTVTRSVPTCTTRRASWDGGWSGSGSSGQPARALAPCWPGHDGLAPQDRTQRGHYSRCERQVRLEYWPAGSPLPIGSRPGLTVVSEKSREQAREQEEEGPELAPAPFHRPRSSAGTPCDLRVWHTGHDRSCPPGSAAGRCGADPARIRRSARRGALRPLAPRDRRCRYGQLSRSFSNSTVTVPSACRVTCATPWRVILEPSEPLAVTLKVTVEVRFWLLRFAPNQNVDLPV